MGWLRVRFGEWDSLPPQVSEGGFEGSVGVEDWLFGGGSLKRLSYRCAVRVRRRSIAVWLALDRRFGNSSVWLAVVWLALRRAAGLERWLHPHELLLGDACAEFLLRGTHSSRRALGVLEAYAVFGLYSPLDVSGRLHFRRRMSLAHRILVRRLWYLLGQVVVRSGRKIHVWDFVGYRAGFYLWPRPRAPRGRRDWLWNIVRRAETWHRACRGRYRVLVSREGAWKLYARIVARARDKAEALVRAQEYGCALLGRVLRLLKAMAGRLEPEPGYSRPEPTPLLLVQASILLEGRPCDVDRPPPTVA